MNSQDLRYIHTPTVDALRSYAGLGLVYPAAADLHSSRSARTPHGRCAPRLARGHGWRRTTAESRGGARTRSIAPWVADRRLRLVSLSRRSSRRRRRPVAAAGNCRRRSAAAAARARLGEPAPAAEPHPADGRRRQHPEREGGGDEERPRSDEEARPRTPTATSLIIRSSIAHCHSSGPAAAARGWWWWWVVEGGAREVRGRAGGGGASTGRWRAPPPPRNVEGEEVANGAEEGAVRHDPVPVQRDEVGERRVRRAGSRWRRRARRSCGGRAPIRLRVREDEYPEHHRQRDAAGVVEEDRVRERRRQLEEHGGGDTTHGRTPSGSSSHPAAAAASSGLRDRHHHPLARKLDLSTRATPPPSESATHDVPYGEKATRSVSLVAFGGCAPPAGSVAHATVEKKSSHAPARAPAPSVIHPALAPALPSIVSGGSPRRRGGTPPPPRTALSSDARTVRTPPSRPRTTTVCTSKAQRREHAERLERRLVHADEQRLRPQPHADAPPALGEVADAVVPQQPPLGRRPAAGGGPPARPRCRSRRPRRGRTAHARPRGRISRSASVAASPSSAPSARHAQFLQRRLLPLGCRGRRRRRPSGAFRICVATAGAASSPPVSRTWRRSGSWRSSRRRDQKPRAPLPRAAAPAPGRGRPAPQARRRRCRRCSRSRRCSSSSTRWSRRRSTSSGRTATAGRRRSPTLRRSTTSCGTRRASSAGWCARRRRSSSGCTSLAAPTRRPSPRRWRSSSPPSPSSSRRRREALDVGRGGEVEGGLVPRDLGARGEGGAAAAAAAEGDQGGEAGARAPGVGARGDHPQAARGARRHPDGDARRDQGARGRDEEDGGRPTRRGSRRRRTRCRRSWRHWRTGARREDQSHKESEEGLGAGRRRMKNEAEVQNWIAMYDRDMEDKARPPPPSPPPPCV